MSRPSSRVFLPVLLVVAWMASAATAQTPAQEAEEFEAASLESLLSELGSPELDAAYLTRRLETASQSERSILARRLADVYVLMLRTETDADMLRDIEARARALAAAVPEIEAAPLRIDLLRASYTRAQDTAERWRLRLTDSTDRAEAERALAQIERELQDLGVRLHRRVEALEREERRGRSDDESLLREALQDARRMRSLAFYYAGWSSYYQTVLTGTPRHAKDAVRQLGWILGAAGESPSLERTAGISFRFDHVSRAAMGVAMALAAQGETSQALRWLDAVEGSPDLSPTIREQVFATRLAVLGDLRRWSELLTLVSLKRREASEPLTPSQARLIAVFALEASRDATDVSGRDELLQAVAQVGLGDLVERGQITHVLDLVDRYGALPLGDEGFIVRYVRALRAYEQARAAHQPESGTADEPATEPEVIGAYRRASDLFLAASRADDADRFESQRSRAGLLRGLSLFFAGALGDAADALEAAASDAGGAEAEEAIWFAIVALDRAVRSDRPSFVDRLDRLARLYLSRFPTSERAARLLLLRAGAQLLDPEQTLGVLLAVAPEDPVYPAARREAARLLYGAFRRSTAEQRDRIGSRFVEVAGGLIELESAIALDGSDEAATAAAQRAVLVCRQAVDVLLSSGNSDARRAARLLSKLEQLMADAGMDPAPLIAEIAYRRLQIAMRLDNAEAVERELATLRREGGEFELAADRTLFRRAQSRFNAATPDSGAAEEVVRFGLRLLRSETLAAESIEEAVAAAAASMYEQTQDEPMLEIARRLDAQRIERGAATEVALRRYARLSLAAGDESAALDAWRRLVAAMPRGSAAWFEARAESLALLARSDPDRAADALAQLELLYPELGPEPWRTRLRALQAELRVLPSAGDTAAEGP